MKLTRELERGERERRNEERYKDKIMKIKGLLNNKREGEQIRYAITLIREYLWATNQIQKNAVCA